jgi:hypothetical protein
MSSSKWENVEARQDRQHPTPLLAYVWSKLPEPRWQRLSSFFIYLCTLIGGAIATFTVPPTLGQFIGSTMVVVLGLFSFGGSIIAIFGVIPDVGWVEQVGVILLFTAVLMYTVALLAASGTAVGPWFAAGLAIALARRWIIIRLHQHH